jgi:hypothetical protein
VVVQASGFTVGPASTDVITPMRATTNRGLEHEGGGVGKKVDGDAKQGGGGAGKSKRKIGHSPDSQEALDIAAKTKKPSRVGKGTGQ